MPNPDKLTLKCRHCGKEIIFDQPYAYHAGFADRGFLYNDAGTLTLVWSVVDPLLEEAFPGQAAWARSLCNRRRFEQMLPSAPDGGRWRFRNPARCVYCRKPISKPMLRTVHYLVYPGSINTVRDNKPDLSEYLAAIS